MNDVSSPHSLEDQFISLAKKWSMLESKFYQAWSEGVLPIEALRSYANEYGAFIAALPGGWLIQGDAETAHEEEEHIELWERFADALRTKIGKAAIPQVRGLLEVAERLFAARATALGALFAFEVQQPETSVSKLEGLRKHYQLSPSAEPYFETHAKNHHEAEKLLTRIAALSPTDRQRAADACEEMSRALRSALDGLYDAHCSSIVTPKPPEGAMCGNY